MCNPFAIQAGMQGAQQVLEFQQRRQEYKLARQGLQRETELIELDAASQRRSLGRREVELRELASAEAEEIASQTVRGLGQARVDAAASGVAGQAIAALFRDVERQGAVGRGDVRRRLRFELLQAGEERGAIERERVGRLMQAQSRVPPKPSLLNLAIGLGGSTLTSFNDNSATIGGQRRLVGFNGEVSG